MSMSLDDSPLEPEDVPGIRGALTRYRVMAWLVGVLLVVLVVVGLPLKYFGGNDAVVVATGGAISTRRIPAAARELVRTKFATPEWIARVP